jgi:uncharacterized cupredoxin-like copper-binding protein
MSERFTLFRRSLACGLTLVALLWLGACSANSDRQQVEVGLSTFGMALSTNTVKTGPITFVVKNNATDQTHEFVVAQTDLPAGQIPVNPDTHLVDEESLTVLGEVEDVDSGAIKRVTLDLKPGRYVLLCNLASHYQSGMHAEFTVTP